MSVERRKKGQPVEPVVNLGGVPVRWPSFDDDAATPAVAPRPEPAVIESGVPVLEPASSGAGKAARGMPAAGLAGASLPFEAARTAKPEQVIELGHHDEGSAPVPGEGAAPHTSDGAVPAADHVALTSDTAPRAADGAPLTVEPTPTAVMPAVRPTQPTTRDLRALGQPGDAWSLLATLSLIGRQPGGGYVRQGLTETDRELRDWFEAQAHSRGMTCETDSAGNQWAWWRVPTALTAEPEPDGGARPDSEPDADAAAHPDSEPTPGAGTQPDSGSGTESVDTAKPGPEAEVDAQATTEEAAAIAGLARAAAIDGPADDGEPVAGNTAVAGATAAGDTAARDTAARDATTAPGSPADAGNESEHDTDTDADSTPPLAPPLRPIVLGSHLDSAPRGGPFDGPLGVCAAFAAIDRLRERGIEPVRDVAVVSFFEEEGSRFGVACLGSRIVSGQFSPERARLLRDADGVSLADAWRAFGLPGLPAADPERIERISRYLELHIEQGIAQEDLAAPVAASSGIWPQGRYRAEFTGQANHAGTTPMRVRRDPMLKLARLIEAVREAAVGNRAVATVGKVTIDPGGAGVVPGRVEAWIDVRAAKEESVRAVISRLAWANPIEESWTPAIRFDRDFATFLVEAITVARTTARPKTDVPAWLHPRQAEAKQRPVPILGTGACHDAGIMQLAGVPSGMMFVRNVTGVSHSPAENATEEDCEAGVAALALALERLATSDRLAPELPPST